MADPYAADLNFFDLVDQPRDVAAARARARAAALGRERAVALASMYSPFEDFQKAGAEQFARTEGERQGVAERMPEGVLKMALAKQGMEKQLAELEIQRGMLGLQGQQLGLEGKKLEFSMLQPFLSTMLGAATNVGTLEAAGKLLGKHAQAITDILKMRPEAQLKAIEALRKGELPKVEQVEQPTAAHAKGKPAAPAGPSHYLVSPDGKTKIAAGPDGRPMPGAVPEPR